MKLNPNNFSRKSLRITKEQQILSKNLIKNSKNIMIICMKLLKIILRVKLTIKIIFKNKLLFYQRKLKNLKNHQLIYFKI